MWRTKLCGLLLAEKRLKGLPEETVEITSKKPSRKESSSLNGKVSS
jgi:hypothetical protein